MNYKLHYDRLIENAKLRSILPTEYKEKHHIIPKSMGGSDEQKNLIDLFPEEHLVAHLLLTKIHPSNRDLLHAAFLMSSYGKLTNKKYSWIRKKVSDKMKIDNPSFREDVKKKLSDSVSKSWENANERKKCFSKKFKGSKNPSAKLYKITDADGKVYMVDGELKKFTEDHGLSINILRNWVGKGVIQRTSKKDMTFFRDASKRKLAGWQIEEIEKK